MNRLAFENLLSKIPKVELQVHLEGSVRPETLLKLAKRHQGAWPADERLEMRRSFEAEYELLEESKQDEYREQAGV